MEIGSVAEWVNIFATVVTIFLSIRFFMDESKVKIKFFGQILNEEKKLKTGVVSYGMDPVLELTVYNYSKVTARVRVEGVRNKPRLIKRFLERFTNFRDTFPITTEGIFLDPKYKFIDIEPYGYVKLPSISLSHIEDCAKINEVELGESIEIVLREIRGKALTYTLIIKK